MKVLIIDDNEADRKAFSALIQRCWKIPTIPLRIVGCGSLAEGLKEASDANVTILDLELPDSPAENTIKSIRLFRPPVIVLTGHDNPEITRDCMIHGADHVFQKGACSALMMSIFESVQKDILRRAGEQIQHEPPE